MEYSGLELMFRHLCSFSKSKSLQLINFIILKSKNSYQFFSYYYFRYLIIDNEQYLNENIRDLFFVTDQRINADILTVIKTHTETYYSQSFKNQLDIFVKYLNHETTDVRLRALKPIKDLLEQNREELDQMILGYNGIDPIVVTLIEALMRGCREKDKELKLMCGEVFGELGAIEPSHLPRRYAEQSESFVFYITEDGFVVNVLTELIRALQAEVKTQVLLFTSLKNSLFTIIYFRIWIDILWQYKKSLKHMQFHQILYVFGNSLIKFSRNLCVHYYHLNI